jgi:hypothetical protein
MCDLLIACYARPESVRAEFGVPESLSAKFSGQWDFHDAEAAVRRLFVKATPAEVLEAIGMVRGRGRWAIPPRGWDLAESSGTYSFVRLADPYSFGLVRPKPVRTCKRCELPVRPSRRHAGSKNAGTHGHPRDECNPAVVAKILNS